MSEAIQPSAPQDSLAHSRALRFVVMIGIVSLFADATYEGARSITGPYLAQLGANGTIVGIVAGLGELLGYGLRLVSGRTADKTQKFWPITLLGYTIQMIAVPSLCLAGSWPVAALLIVAERIGKATRNPPRDVMLSHAGRTIGYGWAFGLNEALDQTGAMIGPLSVAAVLAHHGQYRTAFMMLVIPAVLTLTAVFTARILYPKPETLHGADPVEKDDGKLSPLFWVYLSAAALVAAGFPDFSMMSFHFSKVGAVPPTWIPIFYAVAMGSSGLGSLVFGRLFDRLGIKVLIPLTLITALFVPLVFLGGFWMALLGCALWGLGMGVHESIIPAAVAHMVPLSRRASAYGLFTAGYGVAWFIGSAVIGVLYDWSLPALIGFAVAVELAAIPALIIVTRRLPKSAA